MPADTPPDPHPTPKPGESVTEYRIGVLELSVAGLHRKADRMLEKMFEKDGDHKAAIERCSSHGVAIDTIRNEEIPACHRRIDALQESSGAIAAAKVAAQPPPPEQPVQGRTWPDVFFHPATAGFAAAAFCLVALIVVVSVMTGRPASSFVPIVNEAPTGAKP